MAKQIITKRCSKCKQIKPISEFYKDYSKANGLQSRCKACRELYRQSKKSKEDQKRYWQGKKGKTTRIRYNQSEKGRAAKRRYNKSEKNQIAQNNYKRRHPERIEARKAVNAAITNGILPKVSTLKCSCGNQARHYHHHKGYAKKHQLDVIPICHKCHS